MPPLFFRLACGFMDRTDPFEWLAGGAIDTKQWKSAHTETLPARETKVSPVKRAPCGITTLFYSFGS